MLTAAERWKFESGDWLARGSVPFSLSWVIYYLFSNRRLRSAGERRSIMA
jgi:hypothetical protein